VRSITIHHSGPSLEISIDGTTVVSAPDVPALTAAADGLDPNPLLLGADDRIDLKLKVKERSAVLEACKPDEALAQFLEEHQEDAANEEEDGLGIAPIVTGNVVDGQPWAWYSGSAYYEDYGWFLAPASERHPIIVLHASFESGMVDLQVLAGAWRWDETNSLVWSWRDDLEPNLQTCWPFHDDIDDDDLCANAFSVLFPDGEPDCPFDHDEDLPLFTISDRAPSITDDMIGQGLVEIWRPCKDHLDKILDLGHTWRWHEDRWVPADKE